MEVYHEITSTVTSSDPRDVARCLELFAALEGAAVFGQDARDCIAQIAGELMGRRDQIPRADGPP